MPYTFYNASRLITDSPKNDMLQGFQTMVDENFTLATDVFTIEEETAFDSGSFADVVVRLNHVLGDNGLKLGDDFRKVIFKDPSSARGLGYKFRFDSSIWLTINYDLFGKPTASTVVRKCRNTLRFIDRFTGALIEEPCVIENYSTKEARPSITRSIVMPEGYIVVDVQGNDRTRKIELNQRLILNGIAYKVINILNELNNPTDGSAPLLYIVVSIDTLNPDLDDVVNGIANVNDYQYSLNILQGNFQQVVGFSKTLSAEVHFNGDLVSRSVVWTSSNATVGTVSSAGVINLLALGTVTFRCALVGNPLVYDEVVVDVVAVVVPVVQTIVNPGDTRLLQGETVVYTIYKYVDGVPSADVFTFVASGVPADKYVFTVLGGNSYSIKNVERVMNATLKISATNTTTLLVTDTDYTLGGVF